MALQVTHIWGRADWQLLGTFSAFGPSASSSFIEGSEWAG